MLQSKIGVAVHPPPVCCDQSIPGVVTGLNLTRTTASEVPRPEVCQYRSRPLSCDQRRAELKLLSLIVASMMLFALMV